MKEPSSLTNEELVDALYECATPELLEETRRRLNADVEEIFVLPVSVSEAIRLHFGGGKRTFDSMTRKVRFAFKVWQGKYGPWNPEQAAYAEEVVLWAINQASKGSSPAHSRGLVYGSLNRVVHHERTHEGFKQREADDFIDITEALQEALS